MPDLPFSGEQRRLGNPLSVARGRGGRDLAAPNVAESLLFSKQRVIQVTADCRTIARKTIKRFPKIFSEAEKMPKRR